MKWLLLLALCGCTPFVGYQHLSDPAVAGDGYDLACLGLKHYDDRLMLKAGVCKNLHGGEMATLAVEYDLIGRK